MRWALVRTQQSNMKAMYEAQKTMQEAQIATAPGDIDLPMALVGVNNG